MNPPDDTRTQLGEAVGAIGGIASAINYALAGYDYTHHHQPLADALDELDEQVDIARDALHELTNNEATVTQLHPQEPA